MDIIKQLAIQLKHIGGTTYYVGGYVRNELLGIPSKDIDLVVTNVSQTTLESFLNKHYPNSKLCGKSFGVYKLNIDNIDIDLALPRTEVSTGDDHRDFKVEISTMLEHDLYRRDFKVNAIAKHVLKGHLIDPFNGLRDIRNGYLSSVHKNSIQEDYLRALRAIQFSARFGFKLTKPLIKDIHDNLNLIHTISRERIRMELNKLVVAPNIIQGFQYMKFTGLLRMILPELLVNDTNTFNFMYHPYNTYMHTLHSLQSYTNDHAQPDLEICLALLFHDIGKHNVVSKDKYGVYHNYRHEVISTELAESIMTRLKYDNKTINNVKVLVSNHMHCEVNKKKMCKFFNKYGSGLVDKLIKVWYYDNSSCYDVMSIHDLSNYQRMWQEIVDEQPPYQLKDLAINGYDVMDLGYIGKQIGDVLDTAMELVLEDPDRNEREWLLNYFTFGGTNEN
jgi:tRNA nucleotidyltransferase (CCA-adding enzyme)